MDATFTPYRSRRAQRSAGFTLLETTIALAIVTVIMIVVLREWSLTEYRQEFGYPRVGIVQAASRNLTSELEALAAADPVGLYAQLTPGRTFPVVGGGTGRQNRDVTFTIESVDVPQPAMVGNATPPPTLSYVVHLRYVTHFGDTGTVAISLYRMGADTAGCDPANGVTVRCSEYGVPRQP